MRELNQREICTIALYLLGGESKTVDTEDIALKAAEIAPGKFSWRKYRENIDLALVRLALSNANIENQYVIGSVKEGWMLAPAGLEFAATSASQKWATPTKRRPDRNELQRTREMERMKRTDAYEFIQKNGLSEIHKLGHAQINDFLRVDEYLKGQARDRKLAGLQNMFADDPEFGPLTKAFVKIATEEK